MAVYAEGFLTNGAWYVSSHEVSAYFNRNHQDLCKIIDDLIEHEPVIGKHFYKSGSWYGLSLVGFLLVTKDFNGLLDCKLVVDFVKWFDEC